MAFAYTSKLAYLARSGPFEVQLYVCPPAIRTVVRDLVLRWTEPDHNFDLQIRVPGSSTYNLLYLRTGSESFLHLEMRQAMNEDDELWAVAESGYYTLGVTGYRLFAG